MVLVPGKPLGYPLGWSFTELLFSVFAESAKKIHPAIMLYSTRFCCQDGVKFTLAKVGMHLSQPCYFFPVHSSARPAILI